MDREGPCFCKHSACRDWAGMEDAEVMEVHFIIDIGLCYNYKNMKTFRCVKKHKKMKTYRCRKDRNLNNI
jgi:hypothetical protein